MLGRLNLHLKAMLDSPAAAITRADTVAAVDRIAVDAGETTARRTIGYARSAYRWALRRGTVPGNPFADVPLPGQDVARDRVLNNGEIAEVWSASTGLPEPYGPFVRVLLLTLQRREEVAGMRWGELSADQTTWRLPARRSKNRKAHHVHLTGPVRTELQALGRGRPGELVFRTALATRGRDGKTERRGLVSFSHAKRRLDATIAKARSDAVEAEGVEGAETMPPWIFHDFRRTGVNILADMGVAPHVADRLLNHVTGAIQGVARSTSGRSSCLSGRLPSRPGRTTSPGKSGPPGRPKMCYPTRGNVFPELSRAG